MKRYCSFVLLIVLIALSTAYAQSVQSFNDEFNGNELDRTQWDVFKGNPSVAGGKLTLAGGTTRADISSKRFFPYGVLKIVIESSSWKPQTQNTDSSFGFEVFAGANGNCHYGVILIANGNLGLLKPEPDSNNNCSGDPKFQEYMRIPDWDAIRASGRVFVTLIWSPVEIRLCVSDGSRGSDVSSSINSDAIPDVLLKIRLNVDFNETYAIDYVRFVPCDPIFIDEFNGNALDRTKWDIIGSPSVSSGKLTLTDGSSIQSKQMLLYGVLGMAIESSSWKPRAQNTGSSFGFEIFTGANGNCHYGAVLIANGNLGLLKPKPDSNNNCSGDPTFQEFVPIPDWDTIRASGRVFVKLSWSMAGVRLLVSDGSRSSEVVARMNSEAVPDVPLNIRLKADSNETYLIDYVRFARCEALPLIANVVEDKKKLTISGERFGDGPRVVINDSDRTDFISSTSDTEIKLKGKAKKLGLKAGDNTVQVIDATACGAASNVLILKR